MRKSFSAMGKACVKRPEDAKNGDRIKGGLKAAKCD